MLLMARIRERDKRRGGRFLDSMAYGNLVPRLFYVRNMFFSAHGTGRIYPIGLFDLKPNGGAVRRLQSERPLPTTSIALPHRSDSRLNGYAMKPLEVSIKRPPLVTASNSSTPGRSLLLRKHTEVTCRTGFAYFSLWADISFSNARGWARTCSIGSRRPRPASPVPMPIRPSSASPVPGFISSTNKTGKLLGEE